MITLKIDNREKKLIELITMLNKKHEFNVNFVIEKLDIGDFIIEKDSKECIIIERKSLNDLACSIVDNRYKEQSLRLQNSNIHNHNICYLIEGVFDEWISKIKRINEKTLISSLFSLMFIKGFSIIRTTDRHDTAMHILCLCKKLSKETKSFFYDLSGNIEGKITSTLEDYTNVVSKVKSKNINPTNIDNIILSQIPGISCNTSNFIIKEFGSLFNLLNCMNKNPKCLDDLTYTLKSGTKRHLSKTAIKNIYSYLIEGKVDIIQIKTN